MAHETDLATLHSTIVSHYLHQDKMIWSRIDFLIAFQGLLIIAASNLKWSHTVGGGLMIFALVITFLVYLVVHKDILDRDKNLEIADKLRDALSVNLQIREIQAFRFAKNVRILGIRIRGRYVIGMIFLAFAFLDFSLAWLFFSRIL
jgi:hypothetical protein